jgi:hypothetical protein
MENKVVADNFSAKKENHRSWAIKVPLTVFQRYLFDFFELLQAQSIENGKHLVGLPFKRLAL